MAPAGLGWELTLHLPPQSKHGIGFRLTASNLAWLNVCYEAMLWVLAAQLWKEETIKLVHDSSVAAEANFASQ